MKISYTKRFTPFADFKTTLFMGITSFLISMALHILITFLYHKHAPIRRLFHFTHKDHVNNTRIHFIPLLLLMITITIQLVLTLKSENDRMLSFHGLKSPHCFALQDPSHLPDSRLLPDACLLIKTLMKKDNQFDSACNFIHPPPSSLRLSLRD